MSEWSEWMTLHSDGEEILISRIAVLWARKWGDNTMICLNGTTIVVDEDITKVKAEMFI